MSLAIEHPKGIIDMWEREEIIGGVKYLAPRPTTDHIETGDNLSLLFKGYLWDKKCRFLSEPLVVLTPADKVVPDGVVVCDFNKIKADGIHGAPDIVMEILSPSTKKRDRSQKKDMYERCGVQEYWIVDVKSRTIEVYLLNEGKYYLDNIYQVLEDWQLDMMSDADRAEVEYEFKTHLFDDLIIDVRDVFRNIIN